MGDPAAVASRRSTRRLIAAFGVAAFVLGVDQLTKWLVAARLGPDATSHRFRLVGDVVAIHYAENTGVAFGLLRGQAILVTVAASLVVFFLVRTYRRAGATSWPMAIGCGLIVGGALGNLVDRVRLGHVVDFVEVSRWPTFNAADSAITVGACLLVWRYLSEEEYAGERDRGSALPLGLVALKHDGER